jgi:hypothetical protein
MDRQIWYNGKSVHMRLPLLICSFLLVLPGLVGAEKQSPAKERITVGAHEDVILLPWGVRLPARVDTGAATTSLDARHLVVKGNVAEFQLPEQYGGLQLRLPVVAWKTVRSAEHRERRPVVELEFCLGPKRLHARVNLNDRAQVKYPVIIGRNMLKQGFVVDCTQSSLAPPSCPEPVSR